MIKKVKTGRKESEMLKPLGLSLDQLLWGWCPSPHSRLSFIAVLFFLTLYVDTYPLYRWVNLLKYTAGTPGSEPASVLCVQCWVLLEKYLGSDTISLIIKGHNNEVVFPSAKWGPQGKVFCFRSCKALSKSRGHYLMFLDTSGYLYDYSSRGKHHLQGLNNSL